MLQNKIYQNFFLEIFKTFFIILFGLSIIALTVRAVNFLDLIVDNGYPVLTYFQYSILNLFGIAPKFIPLAFLVSLTVFILKHMEDSEFVILWTSGVKKINVVNLFLLSSVAALIFYILLSAFFTPLALNKSRQLLSADHLNSFLPTVKSQQFSDSFKGFTFIVEKKFKNEVENIFLHDTGNNLRNLSSNVSNTTSTTVIAERGIIDERNMILFNGQIISSKKYNNNENEIIKFQQLNIDLKNLATTTIKEPKIQETSTISLLKCFTSSKIKKSICSDEARKEVYPTLIRRMILPTYIPLVAILCSFLLLRNRSFLLNKFTIFAYCFLTLVLTEILIRYTGINNLLRSIYILSPIFFILVFYFLLSYKFIKEIKKI